MKNMRTKLMSLLGLMVMGITATYGSQPDQPKMNGKLRVTTLSPEEIRYTGKPYSKALGAYVFNYRNYDPQLARWTTPDPSGFPDGANANIYAPIPTYQADALGLTAHWSFANEAYVVKLSIGLITYESMTPQMVDAWRTGIPPVWNYDGTDMKTGKPMTLRVELKMENVGNHLNQTRILDSGYDNAINIFGPRRSWVNHVGGSQGDWAATDTLDVVAHETGHLMGARDMYQDQIINGRTVSVALTGMTVPWSKTKIDWNNTVMGGPRPLPQNATRNDVNHLIQANGYDHYFE